ncbi:MAG: TetR/AcrR family transcriptional regulator C-terminal ligand-binding domain-containing protein [Cyanobacteria bacterium J06621_12]
MSTSKIKKAVNPIKSERGRPRNPETRKKILRAAYEMLIEVGFMDLTIEGVAARAEVGKPTIYRRWKTKSALAMDAFLEAVNPEIAFPDTGMAKEDFRIQMQKLIGLMNSSKGEVLANVIGCGQANEELMAAFRDNWLTPRREDAKRIFKRGIERGEFKEEIDVEAAIDALYSSLFYRLLLKHQPLTNKLVDQLLDIVFEGLEK